jgi:hypothetical protein
VTTDISSRHLFVIKLKGGQKKEGLFDRKKAGEDMVF